ncbi:hypothetical protein BN1723_000863 [Verticillium longisporum]|uniref:Uncharacterized protein n=1 Tax=Verticillium longisporum TaxID=100787 RepID=A0A0G4NCH3_VERLO|nr:hypothetical protein BN1723_000863 [Verticillium longisporum]
MTGLHSSPVHLPSTPPAADRANDRAFGDGMLRQCALELRPGQRGQGKDTPRTPNIRRQGPTKARHDGLSVAVMSHLALLAWGHPSARLGTPLGSVESPVHRRLSLSLFSLPTTLSTSTITIITFTITILLHTLKTPHGQHDLSYPPMRHHVNVTTMASLSLRAAGR